MGLHETSRKIVRNRILASLPAEDFEALRPHLVPIELKRRAIVQEANTPLKHVHFIESGFMSRVARTHSDGLVEVAIVGRYGFIGIGAALGTMVSLNRTLVLIPGMALQICVDDLQTVMRQRPNIREYLLRYVQSLLLQKSQTTLCNVRHELDQRLARWMLLACERLDEDTLPVTQDLLCRPAFVQPGSIRSEGTIGSPLALHPLTANPARTRWAVTQTK